MHIPNSIQIHSLGLATDLAVLDGVCTDRGEYFVARSPKEPGFYGGNLLVFSQVPQRGDFCHWMRCFAKEFLPFPDVLHVTFAWDKSDVIAEVSEFIEAGFKLESTVVLTAKVVKPPQFPNSQLQIRRITDDAGWRDVLRSQMLCREKAHGEEVYLQFATQRLLHYRLRVEKGEGDWFGGYLGGELVASIGIFYLDNTARFQVVVTVPSARRKGICGTMVHFIAEMTLARSEIDTLVMLADEEYHAAKIYESVGFLPTEHLQGLCRWPSS